MHKRKRLTKYFLHALLVFLVIESVVSGSLYIRSRFIKQTVQERSTQLENMLSQIRANLEYGLETHWNIVSIIEAEA